MAHTEELVRLGLDQLSEGFGIFDADLRLVSCNRLYRELRDYPADLCQPGTPFEKMIRFNAERGDFGPGSVEQQVSERLAEIADTDQREVEREMVDGQILNIRYQHLVGGGLTITFRDKTEERHAQHALAQSEERYALVSEAAQEAIYEWNVETDEFYSSPQLEALLGEKISTQRTKSWRWKDWIHPDDQERYETTLGSHLSGELTRWECEYRFKDQHDNYRWISDHGTSVRNETGEAVKMVAAVRDITDRMERDAALATSEERLALVSQATSDGLYDWDVVKDVLYVSGRLNELMDFDTVLTNSHDWSARVHKADLKIYLAALTAYFKSETDQYFAEYRIADRSGDYRWIRDSGIGVRGVDGRVVRLVGAVRDITDIKQAEDNLGRAEARLLDSLETISDGFLLVNAQDKVQLWNRRYMEIFGGATGGDIADIVHEGMPVLDMIRAGYERGMFKPHPGGVEAWIAGRRQARQSVSAALEMELSNGQWLLINERAMSDGGRVSIYTDITEFKRREDELEAARARFEDAIEALSSGFVLFDTDDRIVVCNTRYRDYFPELADMVSPGTPFIDIIRAGVDRGMFPDALDDPDNWLDALLDRRAKTSGVREQYMESGLWLQISDHPTKEGGIVSIYTDVTDLKSREAELRTQSAILEATLENMGQAISMVDENLNVVMFNEKFLDYFNFPSKDFKRGFHMSQAFRLNAERGEYGEGDIEEQIQARLDLSAKFEPHRFERALDDGTTIEMIGNPIRSGGFVTTYTDITERKQAEQTLIDREKALSATLQEFNAVLDTIEYGVLFMGPDLKTRIFNRAFSDMWQFSQEFMDGNPTMRETIEYNKHTGLYDIAPEDWDDWIDSRIEAIRKGEIPVTELHRADGKVLQYQGIVLPDGGRMLTYFDITELKRREMDLTTARDEAERALRDLQSAQERLVQAEKMASLGQLTAGIAHEIKNPLNFVNNFAKLSNEMLGELADLLKGPIASLDDDDRDDAEDLLDTVKGNLDKINEHGRRADSIVRNMLLHSRDAPSEVQKGDLNGILEEALSLAYHGARAENPEFNIEMVKTLDNDVGKIECFPQDLMRVFLNLISNGMYAANRRKISAEDPAAAPGPTLSIKTQAHGDSIIVEVRDTGDGIPKDIQEKIFTPFFTTKPAGEGTGLGLSLSYDIVVKQHGGTIAVESKPGKFTAFIVSLPRVMAQTARTGEAAK